MKRLFSTRWPALLIGLLIAGWKPPSSVAQSILDDLTYYEIGGGQAVRSPASYGRPVRLRGDASLALGYSCGRFDLRSNLRSMFNRLAGQTDDAIASLLYAANASIAALPLYLLRQANPNLANLMENQLLRYEEEYRLAVKSCRDAEREILAGQNPYYDWIRFGQQDTWHKTAGRPVDEVEALVGSRHGCVTWLNGREVFCDEAADDRIHVVEDVAREGYRRLVEAERASGGVPPGHSASRLQILWPDADRAVDEILDITGETVITNTRVRPPEGLPPIGLGVSLTTEAAQTAQALRSAIRSRQSGTLPDAATLETLGVPGLRITPSLLWSLGTLAPDLQAAAVERIASEIALLRAMEKVQVARRILLTGSRIPAVEASPARDLLRNNALALLETEAKWIRDEYDLRQRAAASTAARIVRTGLTRRAGAPSPGAGGVPPRGPVGGAVLR